MTYIIFLGLDGGYGFPNSVLLQIVHNARYLSNLGHVNDSVITQIDQGVLTSGMMLSRGFDLGMYIIERS
jgi:hypothetical protein